MNTYVVGFKPADEKWKQMKKVYDACRTAKVSIPEEVEVFFNFEPPTAAGVEVQIQDTVACTKYKDDMQEGFDIHVDKLPSDVKIIRFYNSW